MFGLNKKNRKVIIGLDGVPFYAIEKLSNNGVMPNTKKLIVQGTFKKMQSSIPEISSVAWSSIITGCNPAEHGIFGFTDIRPDSYSLTFPNFSDLKAKPFWIKENNKKHAIINVPSTYPVKQMNGIHISGFVSIDFEKSVYPDSIKPKLKEINYQIDVNAQLAHKSTRDFLRDLDDTLKARLKAYRYLWDKDKWDTFMLIFTGTDRLGHFLWDALDNEDHKYHKEFIDYFKKIDEVIGEVKDKMNKNDTLIMLSDHGFEVLDENVNINHILKEKGYLKIDKQDKPKLDNLNFKTKAFALDPARIYINEEDKYPKGSAGKDEKKKIINELKGIFSSLERNNKKVIRNIYEKEEIYSGSYMDKAPDLVLVGNKGFDLKGKVNADKSFEENIFKGKHTQDDAFFLIDKKDESLFCEDFSVYDVLDVMKRI